MTSGPTGLGDAEDDVEAIRPTWRGVLHRYAVIAFVPLFAALVVAAGSASHRTAVAVYACSVTTMLAVSAVYHSGRISPSMARRLKRIDHSTILLAIAGSYTAVTVLALRGHTATLLLIAVWGAAVVGISIRMVWLDAPYPLAAAVYLVVGWIALIDFPAYVRALSGLELGLVAGGGVLYTAGGVVYALHKPNPKPAVFGYHEVFHALVVAGATAHYLAVASLIRSH